MQRFAGLLRDTWWLWVIFGGAGVVLSTFVSWFFIVIFPISLFTFVYFGLMRYDEHGNEKKM